MATRTFQRFSNSKKTSNMDTINENEVFRMNDEVVMWLVDSSAIHIKIISQGVDPAELNKEETLELISQLQKLVKKLD